MIGFQNFSENGAIREKFSVSKKFKQMFYEKCKKLR